MGADELQGDALDAAFERYAQEEGASQALAQQAAELARKMIEAMPGDMPGIEDGADSPVVISGLVVETVKEYTSQVAAELVDIPNVEVHQVTGHKIAVTIEAPTVDESAAIAGGFVQITGVIGIDLVYFNFEDDQSLNRGAES